MAHLSGVSNPKSVQVLKFTDGEFIIGRHPDCHLVIDGTSISRRHARFSFNGQDYFLEDLGSRNHTYVNDLELEPTAPPRLLTDQDRVRFCDQEYIFRVGDAPPPEGGILFVDDDVESSSSTIMSKVGVSSGYGSIQLTASPEAKLNALIEINRSLGRALVLDDVLPQVLNSLFKIFVQADRGFIALRDTDGTLVPRWSRARQPDVAETIRVSRTIVNKVMETQEGILSADVMLDEEFNKSQSIADFRIRSMMCAPLLDSLGNSMGVLQIDTIKQSKRFQQEDLEVLLAVASQAGIAIDNAQMHELTLRQRVIERDLELAREVQNGFLPDQRPDVAGYEFFDFYRPAHQVGGDYFDYIHLPGGRLAVIVADVVGKGVAAALLMAKLSAEVRFCLVSAAGVAEATSMLNERLCRMHLDRFVTAVLLLLDPQTHTLAMANAGHMLPILRHARGGIAELGREEADLPLGVKSGLQYRQATVTLVPGDCVTLYTDGLNDAVSEQGAWYSIERIRNQVKKCSGTPAVIGQALVDDVCRFIGQGAQSDDMCVVTFGRLG